MTDINPELIEKALREFIKPRMHTNMALDGTRANLTAALSAVADDLRAEGAAPKKHIYRNDIDYAPDGTAWSWTVAECECDQPWRHA